MLFFLQQGARTIFCFSILFFRVLLLLLLSYILYNSLFDVVVVSASLVFWILNFSQAIPRKPSVPSEKLNKYFK